MFVQIIWVNAMNMAEIWLKLALNTNQSFKAHQIDKNLVHVKVVKKNSHVSDAEFNRET